MPLVAPLAEMKGLVPRVPWLMEWACVGAGERVPAVLNWRTPPGAVLEVGVTPR